MLDLFAAVVLWFKHMNGLLAARIHDSYGMYYIRRMRRSYLPRLVRAHRYSFTSAKHRYNRRDKTQVTARTPQEQRTYNAPVAAVEPVFAAWSGARPPQWENTDAVLADPAWATELQERLRAAHLTMIPKGPNNDQDTSHMGRDQNPDGQNDRAEKSVHSREGWGNNRRFHAPRDRGRLQRAAERVQARGATLLDLVHEDDFTFSVPQLRRLPQPAR